MTGDGLGDALRIVVDAPRLWVLALAGFLVRGGIVLVALPILVVPSVVGLVTFIGPDAVTAAGLSPRFIVLTVATGLALGLWLVLGLVVGVLVELALVEAVVSVPDPAGRPAAPDRGRGRLVVRLLVVRVACLVPIALAVAIAGARLFDVGYHEMILPGDTATPLVWRILRGAPEAIAIVALVWLVAEVGAAIATRLAIVEHRSTVGALVGSIGWAIRRPLRFVSTAIATVVGSILVLVPAVAAAGLAWGTVRDILLGSLEPVATILASLAFVAVWVVALGLAGLVAAWRSVAWSLAVAGDHRVGGTEPLVGGTL